MLPDIFIYNPTCDFAIANGSPDWHPNRLLKTMEEDLETLPVFLASEGDYIIVSKLPTGEYLERIDRLGVSDVKFILKRDIQSFSAKINRLLPWGWSPATHKLLEPIKYFCNEEFKLSPVFNWNPERNEFYSRTFAARLLYNLINENPLSFLIGKSSLPIKCFYQTEIENCLNRWGNIVIKAPWSSSGRGLQTISKIPVHWAVWQRIGGLLKDQGFVMAEPYLNKKMDLAFEFSLWNKQVSFSGMSFFLTDHKGQYRGNYLNGISQTTGADLIDFLTEHTNWIKDKLTKQIQKSNLPDNYDGYFGIDALIFSDSNNQLCINPCLELNLRFTMGILALNLEKLIVPEKKGMLKFFFQPGKDFQRFSSEMTIKFPPVIVNKKLESGYFPISVIRDTTSFGAYLLIP